MLPWSYVKPSERPESDSRHLRGQVGCPGKKIPFKSVTIQIIRRVESHSTEIYSRILFLEEANKITGRIILNGIIFDNKNYLGRFTSAMST